MYILLIFYILFLLVYIGVNAYIIFRVNSMRIKNDLTTRGIVVYMIAISLVMFICFSIIVNLDWKSSLVGMGGKIGF